MDWNCMARAAQRAGASGSEEEIEEWLKIHSGPIHMILTCPACGERHIDEGEFTEKRHHTHACQHCGMVWRPSVEHTLGVQFLPGFKNRI